MSVDNHSHDQVLKTRYFVVILQGSEELFFSEPLPRQSSYRSEAVSSIGSRSMGSLHRHRSVTSRLGDDEEEPDIGGDDMEVQKDG